MRRLEELRLLGATDLTFAGRLRYLYARWSVSRWAPKGLLPHSQLCLKRRAGGPFNVRLATTDVLVFREVFLERCYRPLIAALELEPPQSRPMRILDLGANVGLAALDFLMVYPTAHLLCVEPEPGNFGQLAKNLAGFGAARITLLQAFAGGDSGVGFLDNGCGGEWGFQLRRAPAASNGTAIPVLDLPAILDTAGWDHVDLVKCDIEGSEAELFAVAEQWIDRAAALIVELHAPYTAADLERHLAGLRSWTIRAVLPNGCNSLCALRRKGASAGH